MDRRILLIKFRRNSTIHFVQDIGSQHDHLLVAISSLHNKFTGYVLWKVGLRYSGQRFCAAVEEKDSTEI